MLTSSSCSRLTAITAQRETDRPPTEPRHPPAATTHPRSSHNITASLPAHLHQHQKSHNTPALQSQHHRISTCSSASAPEEPQHTRAPVTTSPHLYLLICISTRRATTHPRSSHNITASLPAHLHQHQKSHNTPASSHNITASLPAHLHQHQKSHNTLALQSQHHRISTCSSASAPEEPQHTRAPVTTSPHLYLLICISTRRATTHPRSSHNITASLPAHLHQHQKSKQTQRLTRNALR